MFFFLILISWKISMTGKFLKFGHIAKRKASKMQNFCAWVDPQSFLYEEISTFEVGCKGSFFVVFSCFMFL